MGMPSLRPVLMPGYGSPAIRGKRDFARAMGQQAKTNVLDARMLAEMAHAFHGRLRAHTPAPEWERELRAWLRRHH